MPLVGDDECAHRLLSLPGNLAAHALSHVSSNQSAETAVAKPQGPSSCCTLIICAVALVLVTETWLSRVWHMCHSALSPLNISKAQKDYAADTTGWCSLPRGQYLQNL